MDEREDAKRAAAHAAALEVADGMRVGLGTGSTVAHFLPALARRGLSGLRCVATSVRSEKDARALGIPVEAFDTLDRLDIAVDGADQVASDRWLMKGGGGAHTREKVVAAAAERFVVIADSHKTVERLAPPVPLEVLRFGMPATIATLSRLGSPKVRDAPPTPDGNVLFDLFDCDLSKPTSLAARLEAVPGLVGHGLFPPSMVSLVLVGRSDGLVRRA